MNRRIREIWDSLDLRTIIGTTLLIATVLFLIVYLPGIRDRIRADDIQKYEGQTFGQVLRIEKFDRMTNSKWKGTEIYTDSYKITYRYEVDGKIFHSMDLIPATAQNKTLLSTLLGKHDNLCIVKFNIDSPEKSLLVSDE